MWFVRVVYYCVRVLFYVCVSGLRMIVYVLVRFLVLVYTCVVCVLNYCVRAFVYALVDIVRVAHVLLCVTLYDVLSELHLIV